MHYLLDANAVIALLNDSRSAVARRVRRERLSDIAIPTIVAHELYYGALKSLQQAFNVARLDGLRFPVLELDREDAIVAAELRTLLTAAGTPIGPYDTLIAGQAVARNLILVTHNTREFGRVPRLQLEDWEI
jgi:tRNA(fMet)-specific endonuclease VapC